MCLGLCLRWGCIPPPFFQFKDAALKAELLSAASLDNSAVFQLSSDFETDSVEVQYSMAWSSVRLRSLLGKLAGLLASVQPLLMFISSLQWNTNFNNVITVFCCPSSSTSVCAQSVQGGLKLVEWMYLSLNICVHRNYASDAILQALITILFLIMIQVYLATTWRLHWSADSCWFLPVTCNIHNIKFTSLLRFAWYQSTIYT